MILIWPWPQHDTQGRLFHGIDLLTTHWIKTKLDKCESLQCVNIETFKEVLISQLWRFPYHIYCEEGRLRKGQGIINSHTFTLSVWARGLPIKPSLWQSWLLQNTISYCFSILGQRTRATGSLCTAHTLRDMGGISSDCVYSQVHICYVFLLLWWIISNNNADV